MEIKEKMKRPNVLFIMTDQQRFDTIAALGNRHIYTPNFDRLVKRGLSFSNAYSTCPVCIPARYIVRTGCEPATIGVFQNSEPVHISDKSDTIEKRSGPYLAKTMKNLGYRTFGIGKFHSIPWDENLGYDIQLHSEELYTVPGQRDRDAYASFIKKEHPAFAFIEQLHGERTDMYYMPQMSPLPAELTVEAWAANEAVKLINIKDEKPYFGFVSFIGPHPPLAPPIPYNRMYNPDKMPAPVRGEAENDHMDEQIPWMNHLIWAEDINDSQARVLKARYYGEISYIDTCLGKILDAVESSKEAGNTLICFFSDHGDHLGDHNAWQKESFFDVSCRIPFLLSWPAKLPAGNTRDELVSLADLFGIATAAAGSIEKRDGIDLLGTIEGRTPGREYLTGMHGDPGSQHFKIMIRDKNWKYIFMANGGFEQLYNMHEDPFELKNLAQTETSLLNRMRQIAASQCNTPFAKDALAPDGCIKSFPYVSRGKQRIFQFDSSRGIDSYPENPADALI